MNRDNNPLKALKGESVPSAVRSGIHTRLLNLPMRKRLTINRTMAAVVCVVVVVVLAFTPIGARALAWAQGVFGRLAQITNGDNELFALEQHAQDEHIIATVVPSPALSEAPLSTPAAAYGQINATSVPDKMDEFSPARVSITQTYYDGVQISYAYRIEGVRREPWSPSEEEFIRMREVPDNIIIDHSYTDMEMDAWAEPLTQGGDGGWVQYSVSVGDGLHLEDGLYANPRKTYVEKGDGVVIGSFISDNKLPESARNKDAITVEVELISTRIYYYQRDGVRYDIIEDFPRTRIMVTVPRSTDDVRVVSGFSQNDAYDVQAEVVSTPINAQITLKLIPNGEDDARAEWIARQHLREHADGIDALVGFYAVDDEGNRLRVGMIEQQDDIDGQTFYMTVPDPGDTLILRPDYRLSGLCLDEDIVIELSRR